MRRCGHATSPPHSHDGHSQRVVLGRRLHLGDAMTIERAKARPPSEPQPVSEGGAFLDFLGIAILIVTLTGLAIAVALTAAFAGITWLIEAVRS